MTIWELDEMTAPLVEWYSDDVLCEVVKVEQQGQINIEVTSTLLEEAQTITEYNSTLDVMGINGLEQSQKALIDA